jgi:hypothetical protein
MHRGFYHINASQDIPPVRIACNGIRKFVDTVEKSSSGHHRVASAFVITLVKVIRFKGNVESRPAGDEISVEK